MEITPDAYIYWQYGFAKLNLTILATWGIMLLLSLISWLATRRLSSGPDIGRWQNVMEAVVSLIERQTSDIMQRKDPHRFMAFLGTIFLFVATSNLLTILPRYEAPTGSLSTTTALAICVFVAVPTWGIRELGLGRYLKSYLAPNPIMLPFNIISELSRTVALAVRLFGNIMSGSLIVAILLSVVPIIFPVLMTVLGLLTGMVQAYIFFVLAAVYVAAGMRAMGSGKKKAQQQDKEEDLHG